MTEEKFIKTAKDISNQIIKLMEDENVSERCKNRMASEIAFYTILYASGNRLYDVLALTSLLEYQLLKEWEFTHKDDNKPTLRFGEN